MPRHSINAGGSLGQTVFTPQVKAAPTDPTSRRLAGTVPDLYGTVTGSTTTGGAVVGQSGRAGATSSATVTAGAITGRAARAGTVTGSTTTAGTTTGTVARLALISGSTTTSGTVAGREGDSSAISGATTTAGTAVGWAARTGAITGATVSGGIVEVPVPPVYDDGGDRALMAWAKRGRQTRTVEARSGAVAGTTYSTGTVVGIRTEASVVASVSVSILRQRRQLVDLILVGEL